MAKPADADALALTIEALRDVLRAQLEIGDSVIRQIAADRKATNLEERVLGLPDKTGEVVGVLLYSATCSCNTLLTLSRHIGLQVKDCFVIARGVIETAINGCFILGHGEKMAAQADRHAMQKSFRYLRRQSSVGGFELRFWHSNPLDFDAVPGLLEATKEFTAKNDRELNWCRETVEQRLAFVLEQFGADAVGLHRSQFGIYKYASEISHGSYFGCLFLMGETTPGLLLKRGNPIFALSNHLLSILFSTVEAMDSFIRCFHRCFPIPNAYSDLTKEMNRLLDIPLFAELLTDPDYIGPTPYY